MGGVVIVSQVRKVKSRGGEVARGVASPRKGAQVVVPGSTGGTQIQVSYKPHIAYSGIQAGDENAD